MRMKSTSVAVFCIILSFLLLSSGLKAQVSVNRDTLLLAACEIMNETHYCALTTMDSTGQPQTRTMNPFPANDELVTWFATSRTCRKVRELKANPKVCVYYADHVNAKGYVSITGTAKGDRKSVV